MEILVLNGNPRANGNTPRLRREDGAVSYRTERRPTDGI